MVILTGDMHGQTERICDFCSEYETTTEDVMIILGDAGINYWGGSADDDKKISLSELDITILCIHGNHEERPQNISGYIEKEWRGGIVMYEEEYPNILFAVDGEIYDFDGKKAIAIGGAYSVDKYYRLARGWSWFPDEQPSEEIKAKVERVLAERNWKIDIVLSHTGPLKYEPTEVFLPMIDQSSVDKSTEVWLDQIEAKLDYERWYFAHYHTEKEVDKIRIMHNDYAMIPREPSVAAEKDMIRRMHRQAEIVEALGLLDDAPNQENGDDIS